jgi:hypothetical protein
MISETPNSTTTTTSTPSPPERIYFLSQRERDRLEKRASRMAFKDECLEFVCSFPSPPSPRLLIFLSFSLLNRQRLILIARVKQ